MGAFPTAAIYYVLLAPGLRGTGQTSDGGSYQDHVDTSPPSVARHRMRLNARKQNWPSLIRGSLAAVHGRGAGQ
jgi:hypothetical protein